MINELVMYGDVSSLKEYKNVNFDEFIDSRWNINCFGVDAYAYCEDLITEEDLSTLTSTFKLVGGMNSHIAHVKEYSGIAVGWMNKVLFKDGEFARSIGLLQQKQSIEYFRENAQLSLYNFSCQAASRSVPIFEHNTAVQYLINSKQISINEIPNLWDIGKELLENSNKRLSGMSGKDSVGGDGVKSSPINASNIIYATADRNIVVGHWHALQQFYNYNTMSLALKELYFNSSIHSPVYSDIYTVIAKYLGIEMREIV